MRVFSLSLSPQGCLEVQGFEPKIFGMLFLIPLSNVPSNLEEDNNLIAQDITQPRKGNYLMVPNLDFVWRVLSQDLSSCLLPEDL